MTTRSKSTILLLIILCFPIFLLTQTSKEDALTLDQCINIAIEQNPLVLSAMQQYNASLARVNQAKAFAQPSINWDSDLQPKL
jgi:outer membrane protein TolC